MHRISYHLSSSRTRWVDVVEHPFSRNRSATFQRPFYTWFSSSRASSFRWEFREPEIWSPSNLDATEMKFPFYLLSLFSVTLFRWNHCCPEAHNVQRQQIRSCSRIVILWCDKKREAIIAIHTEHDRTSPAFSWMQSFRLCTKCQWTPITLVCIVQICFVILVCKYNNSR